MRRSSLETSQNAARNNQELLTLYSSYASATKGSEAYTTALNALAQALGLTAEQAQNADTNIRELTITQLNQAAADARAAMDRWNFLRNEIVPFDFDNLWQTVQISFRAMTGRDVTWDTVFYTLQTMMERGDISSVVRSYEQLRDLQADMNAQAHEMGINVTTMEGYTQL